jgi:glyoxylase-like metal-dependent hydrolase (beta-lactamase superfamily II)
MLLRMMVFALVAWSVADNRAEVFPTTSQAQEKLPANQQAQPVAANFDVQKLAEGIYAVIRKEPPGFMVDANNLFIINDEDVIVVDANGAPAITREVLAALRKLTSKPVKYVINTHYHDDHIRGNQVYREAFPNVEFIGHAFARDYLPNQGATNRKGFLEGAPKFAAQIKEHLAKNESLFGGEMSGEERDSLQNDIRLVDLVLSEGSQAQTVLPTITVEDRLTLYRGNRVIDIRHFGKGHTAADLVVHLPQEGILVTGDLVVWPVPLVGNPQSHIGDWATTLNQLRALKPTIIVPGHGQVLRDDSYVKTLAEMFAFIKEQVDASLAKGESLEQAQKGVNLAEFRNRLAGDSKVKKALFANYVAYPAIAAAYGEANGKRRSQK